MCKHPDHIRIRGPETVWVGWNPEIPSTPAGETLVVWEVCQTCNARERIPFKMEA